MITKNYSNKKALVERLLDSPPTAKSGNLSHVVTAIQAKAPKFKALTTRHQTPFYALDSEALRQSAQRYLSAFSSALPNATHFYAIKVNHHPTVLKTVFSLGFGADVSSGRELELALQAGANRIVFSGPAKTKEELRKALEHSKNVTVNIDSFSELKKLSTLAEATGVTIDAGVRVSFKEHGAWGKFGIPLSECNRFFAEASAYSSINLIGIQFHISWNADAKPYEVAIKTLASYLRDSLDPRHLAQIRFIDIGGGFRPHNAEGYYPEDTSIGAAVQAACEEFEEDPEFSERYYITEALPIEGYADAIGAAIDTHLRPVVTCEYYTEPGRIICNDSMHVVLSVEDIKSDECVILNGGTNIVGFERFEFDYFPLINITNPSLSEIPCMMYGSLCMPQDYWGLYVYASKLQEGDTIIVPYQGALTFANMQDFIKGRVEVYELEP